MRKIVAISLLLLLVSCSQDETQEGSKIVSASACAQKQADGSIKECSPDEEDLNSLKSAHNFYKELNKELPGPSFPGFNNQFKVIKATRFGVLELEDGQIISLAGLECDHNDLAKYLNLLLIQERNTKVVFIPTGYEVNKIKYAYIWEVSAPTELPESNYSIGPSWSSTNETAISSKWCKPLSHEQHKYHARYIKIAEEFN